ncbi:unnamed protein product [Rotaria magnacalcarata]|uniref:DUF155 domain-containing protein n=4 Tax=Rotaria magnacalcarata TaxID=392030 RepID=A0A815EJX1_9BILA|nr:unnamed protein product [Rotaria magnacalcarata]
MFLRIIRSFDKIISLQGIKFSRFASHASPASSEVRSSCPPAPGHSCNRSNSKQVMPTTEVSSSMKLPVLKRLPRKKPAWKESNFANQYEGQYFSLTAYATADWYDLNQLKQRLTSLSKPFQLVHISDLIENVLCIQIHRDGTKKSEAFIFDDGAVIFWNVKHDDEKIILKEVTRTFV